MEIVRRQLRAEVQCPPTIRARSVVRLLPGFDRDEFDAVFPDVGKGLPEFHVDITLAVDAGHPAELVFDMLARIKADKPCTVLVEDVKISDVWFGPFIE